MKFLEKFIIKKLVKRLAKEIPMAEEKIKAVWEEHNEEIFEKIVEFVKGLILKLIAKVK